MGLGKLALIAGVVAIVTACSGSEVTPEPEDDPDTQPKDLLGDPADGGEPQQNTTLRVLQLNHYQEECFGSSVQLCLLGRSAGSTEWEYEYDPIEGFNFEWGFEYELELLVTGVTNPPSDASNVKLSLVRELKKEPVSVDQTFNYNAFHANDHFVKVSESRYKLFNHVDKVLECIDASVCAELDAQLENDVHLRLLFAHGDTSTAPLKLMKIICADTPASFHRNCLGQASDAEIGKTLVAQLSVFDKFMQPADTFSPREPINFELNIFNFENSIQHDLIDLDSYKLSLLRNGKIIWTSTNLIHSSASDNSHSLTTGESIVMQTGFRQRETATEVQIPPGSYKAQVQDSYGTVLATTTLRVR